MARIDKRFYGQLMSTVRRGRSGFQEKGPWGANILNKMKPARPRKNTNYFDCLCDIVNDWLMKCSSCSTQLEVVPCRCDILLVSVYIVDPFIPARLIPSSPLTAVRSSRKHVVQQTNCAQAARYFPPFTPRNQLLCYST